MDSETCSSSSSSDFPSDVLKWMKANAEPEMALKLMQVCKYFRHKEFPYLVVKSLNKNRCGRWYYSRFGSDQESVTATLDIFNDKSLWITEHLCLYQKVDPFSSILSKIAVCKAQHLFLDSQNLTIDEFKMLSTSTKYKFVNLYNTTITDKNDELIALEVLLQIIPDVTFLSFDTIVPSVVSLPDASKIIVPNIKLFEAHGLRETFNFQAFTEFMKTHPFIQCRIAFDERFALSPEYQHQIEEYIGKLISDNSIKDPPPIIQFPGQTLEYNLDALHKRYGERIYSEAKLIPRRLDTVTFRNRKAIKPPQKVEITDKNELYDFTEVQKDARASLDNFIEPP